MTSETNSSRVSTSFRRSALISRSTPASWYCPIRSMASDTLPTKPPNGPRPARGARRGGHPPPVVLALTPKKPAPVAELRPPRVDKTAPPRVLGEMGGFPIPPRRARGGGADTAGAGAPPRQHGPAFQDRLV